MVTLYVGILAIVGMERLLELSLSQRHARWSFARGGKEFGRGHLWPMKLLHAALLLSCLVESLVRARLGPPRTFWPPWLAVVLGAQALRYWAVYTLGCRWNVRVIVLPGIAAIRHGPYRWLRHPNYVAVMLEGVALPMLGGAWIAAVVFFVLNAWLLWVRIDCEERALATFCPAPAAAATASVGLP